MLRMDGWNVRRRVLGASGCWLEASPRPLQPSVGDSHHSKPLLCRGSGGMTSPAESIITFRVHTREVTHPTSSTQKAGIFTISHVVWVQRT